MPARPVPRPAELGEVVRIPLPRLRGGSAESAVQRLRNGSALALSPRSEASSTLGEVRRTERPLGATRNAENLLSRAVQNGGRVCGRHCDERSRRVKTVSRCCDPKSPNRCPASRMSCCQEWRAYYPFRRSGDWQAGSRGAWRRMGGRCLRHGGWGWVRNPGVGRRPCSAASMRWHRVCARRAPRRLFPAPVLAGQAEPGSARAWPPFPRGSGCGTMVGGTRRRDRARALLTAAGMARRGGSGGQRGGRRCCRPAPAARAVSQRL